MSQSNKRNHEYGTVHHLVSRVAHRVYILDEDARNDLLAMARRVSEFSGVELIGWCVLDNHFHLLAYLPEPAEPDEAELLRRYGVLKGESRRAELENRIGRWRSQGAAGEVLAKDELDRIRKRMYDIGEYMKTIKQWFSEEYNRRNGHKGTMWESVYHDRVVRRNERDLRGVMVYISLNPVRAGVTAEFDTYRWSSFTSFAEGDELAAKGMRFVYGDAMTDEEIVAVHRRLMSEALEAEKRERARAIACKRAAGVEAAHDPLTDEAMVIAETERMRRAKDAYEELKMNASAAQHTEMRRVDADCQRVMQELSGVRETDVKTLMMATGMPERKTYRILAKLRKEGLVEKGSGPGQWIVKVSKTGLTCF